MKKLLLLCLLLLMVGCSGKPDVTCTYSDEYFTTTISLYFENDKLSKALNISEYESSEVASAICSNLPDKVKCSKEKIQILNYLDDEIGVSSRVKIVEDLEDQGYSCK